MNVFRFKLSILTCFAVFLSFLAHAFWPTLDCYSQIYLNLHKTVRLNGYSLSLVDCGKRADKPTIIIEAGLNQTKKAYFGLQRRLMHRARVITYDHAGIGGSTVSGNPRTLPFYVEELNALMDTQGLKPPYIFIGHSMGGLIVRYYAYLHPESVSGLVFLDHAHEDWFRYVRENWSSEDQRRYLDYFDPEITNLEQIKLVERAFYEKNQDIIRGIQIPSDIPVLMFTANNANAFRDSSSAYMKDRNVWAEMQSSLIKGVEDTTQVIDWSSGHWPHADKPEVVSHLIADFVGRVQQTSPSSK